MAGKREGWTSAHLAAAAALGIAGGVIFAEWDRFSNWLLDTSWDWSSLPAVFVGTAIPATAGFLLADRLAERNTRELRLAQLEADRDFAASAEQAELAGIEDRRQRWERIRSASDDIYHGLRPSRTVKYEMVAAAADLLGDAVTSEERSELTRFAEAFLIEPIVLRNGLPTLRAEIEAQISSGRVVRLTPVSQSLTRLADYVAPGPRWIDDRPEELAQRFLDRPADWTRNSPVDLPLVRCFGMLSAIADRERSAVPLEDFDPFTNWAIWIDKAHSYDVPQEFARLSDSIDRLDDLPEQLT